MADIINKNFTADGTTNIITSSGYGYAVQVYGTLGGGNFSIQVDYSGDDANFVGILNTTGDDIVTISAIGVFFIKPLKVGARVRAVLAGSTTPNITLIIR